MKWQPIQTYKIEYHDVWIGDTSTGKMAYASQNRFSKAWYYHDSGRCVPWKPDVWQPIPLSPEPSDLECYDLGVL